jgi:hypothetical protein
MKMWIVLGRLSFLHHTTFQLCEKKLFQMMYETPANNTLVFVFVPKLQVPEIPALYRQTMYPASNLGRQYCLQ